MTQSLNCTSELSLKLKPPPFQMEWLSLMTQPVMIGLAE